MCTAPKASDPPPPPPEQPTQADASTAGSREKRRQKGMAGYGGTIMTSPQGALAPANTGKTILGA